MIDPSIQKRYYQLLHAYVTAPDEAALAAAEALGRELVRAGVPPEEIGELHEEATRRLGREHPEITLLETARRLAEPLMELLMAYGLAYREQLEEHRRAQEALGESEARYRALVEQSLVGVYLVNEGGFVYQNEAGAKMFGYSSEEILGVKPLELVHPEDRTLVAENIRKRLVGEEKGLRYTFRGLRKDGTTMECEVFGRRIIYQGQPAILGTCVDITEQKEAERLRRVSYRISEAALTSRNLGELYGLIHREIGTIMDVTNFYISLYDKDEDLLLFTYFVDEHHPGLDPWQKHHRQSGKGLTEYLIKAGKGLLLTGSVIEELATKGKIEIIGPLPAVWMGAPLKTEDRIIGALAVQNYKSPTAYKQQDLELLEFVSGQVAGTIERKRAEEALRDSEAKYRSLFDDALDMIHMVDTNGRIIDANKVELKTLGYSKEEYIGKPILEIVHSDFRKITQKSMGKIWQGEKVMGYETVLVTKNGKKINVKVNAVPEIIDQTVVSARAIIRDITAQKKAEAALQESEAKYRAIVEGSLQGIIILQDFKIVYANPAFARMAGYTVEEILALSPDQVQTLVHPEDQAMVWGRYRDRLAGKELPSEYAYRGVRKDGKVVWLEMYATRIEYGGQPAVQAAIIDITGRKAAEEALRLSEQNYRELFNTTTDAIFIHDREGRFIDVNPAVVNLYGYNREELLGQTPVMLTDAEKIDPGLAAEYLKRAFAGEVVQFEWWGHRKDGRTFPKDVILTRASYNGQEVVIASARDITDRKAAEEALQESEERYRTLAENAQDAIYLITPSGFEYVNPAFERLFGYQAQEVYDPEFDFFELIHPQDRELIVKREQAREDGREVPPTYQFRVLTKEGQERYVEAATHPLPGGKVRVLGVLRDVTERKAMQQRLLLTERLAAIGQVAAGVAHEVNTPLANISLVADNLLETTQDEAAATAARQVLEQVDFAAHIVRDLLNFARPSEPSLEALDLHHLIESALGQLETPAWLKVDRRLAEALPPLQGDRVHLQEVFTNLIRNALDAMAAQGKGTLTLKTRRLDSQVEATIRDSGPGIPAEDLEHIFEPFFSTKPVGKGTGLGLPLAQRFIHDHGGTIDIKSKPGLGTRVTVTLPLGFIAGHDETHELIMDH